MKELLMGNEAVAVGALAAGVQVVAGYPGTPSSEVLETIAKRNPGHVYVEWSVNEKAGAEVAAGAAYAGARSLVTMKQMGLNVASDPVMCVNYIGVKGGMVIYVCDARARFHPRRSRTREASPGTRTSRALTATVPSRPSRPCRMLLHFRKSMKRRSF